MKKAPKTPRVKPFSKPMRDKSGKDKFIEPGADYFLPHGDTYPKGATTKEKAKFYKTKSKATKKRAVKNADTYKAGVKKK